MEMEVEQMMTCLLAEVRTNREKVDANQAKITANQEMLAEMKSNQAKVLAMMEARMDFNGNERRNESWSRTF
jgi:hypothetical protein